jgi:hypothetical protein
VLKAFSTSPLKNVLASLRNVLSEPKSPTGKLVMPSHRNLINDQLMFQLHGNYTFINKLSLRMRTVFSCFCLGCFLRFVKRTH